MGFFDFFKKKPETVSFDELEPFLEGVVKRKKLGEAVARFNDSVRSLREEAFNALRELSSAELEEGRFSEKEKHVMRGNRERYVTRLKAFFQGLREAEDLEEAGFLASRISEEVNRLAVETEKNFFILKEFFPEESWKLARLVKKAEEVHNALRKALDDPDLARVKDAEALLKRYYEELEKEELLKKNVASLRSSLEKEKSRREKLAARLEELRNGKDYEAFEELLAEREALKAAVSEKEAEVESKVAGAAKELRKLLHDSKEKYLKKYLENPVEALLEDQGFSMKKFFAQTSNSRLATYLEEAKTFLESSAERLKNLESSVKKNVAALNVAEQEALVEECERRVERLEAQVSEAESELDSLRPGELRRRVKEVVEGLGVVVKD